MRRRLRPFPNAAAAAREVLALRGICTPEDIDLEALAADHWITVRRAWIGNAEGRLLRSGRRGIVTIDEGAFASEKWRFVLAHELGHYILHALRFDLSCFPKRGATREEKSRSFLDEEAASGFGSTLLLPDDMVVPRYDRAASPMERARALASTFGVSLPVGALRVLDFTDEPCAVAYVEKGRVAWCTATQAFGVNVPNREIPAASEVDGVARVTTAESWGKPASGVRRVFEQSVSLAPFDAHVTMLWHEAPSVAREGIARIAE